MSPTLFDYLAAARRDAQGDKVALLQFRPRGQSSLPAPAAPPNTPPATLPPVAAATPATPPPPVPPQQGGLW